MSVAPDMLKILSVKALTCSREYMVIRRLSFSAVTAQPPLTCRTERKWHQPPDRAHRVPRLSARTGRHDLGNLRRQLSQLIGSNRTPPMCRRRQHGQSLALRCGANRRVIYHQELDAQCGGAAGDIEAIAARQIGCAKF